MFTISPRHGRNPRQRYDLRYRSGTGTLLGRSCCCPPQGTWHSWDCSPGSILNTCSATTSPPWCWQVLLLCSNSTRENGVKKSVTTCGDNNLNNLLVYRPLIIVRDDKAVSQVHGNRIKWCWHIHPTSSASKSVFAVFHVQWKGMVTRWFWCQVGTLTPVAHSTHIFI